MVDLEVEFNIVEGFYGYELEWFSNYNEYECTINTVTATVYEFERN